MKPDRIAAPRVKRGRLLRQVAALPLRRAPDGAPAVLLVTSRGTGRWVLPKGNEIKGLGRAGSAAEEAWEEAGVRGAVEPRPLGVYEYLKLTDAGALRPCRVEVFRLTVTEQRSDWPERGERMRAWMPAREAARRVAEPGLAALLEALVEALD